MRTLAVFVLLFPLLGGAASCTRNEPAPARAQAVSDTCEHGAKKALCARCNPKLEAVFKAKGDWCDEHGVPESQCLKCNPSLTSSKAAEPAPSEPWCNEHGVPEAKCTKCRPELIAKFIEEGDFCREHGLPESVCPVCHPERVRAAGHELPVYPKPGTVVKLSSPEKGRLAGIETIRATPRPLATGIDVVGQIQFNQNRHAKLSARGEALVLEVKVDIGDEVKRGQALVVLASSGVGEQQSKLAAARARLDAARATLAREQALVESGISSRKSVDAARTEVAAAKAELDAARAALGASGAGTSGAGGRYVLTSPFAGTVVSREAVMGKSVTGEVPLVAVADLASMWAILEVPEDAAASVRRGQKVTLRFEGLGGALREGTIDRIGASVDANTRTVRARVDLPNQDRSLRAGLFVRARIEVTARRKALLVPRDAVQRAEGRALVFIKTAASEYKPVQVHLGAQAGSEVEVLAGLSAGAEVVTTGAFLLKSEILKDAMGAGCADD
ncbi:MAG: efflux RND transporter periplasmic adaptor subunit [Deltaproteobacteria bacterium]|nr:efflux RND transporter periplasmic adaptor subunit [Deltaproteobacteria bacterium]